jgi:hypothetical protein
MLWEIQDREIQDRRNYPRVSNASTGYRFPSTQSDQLEIAEIRGQEIRGQTGRTLSSNILWVFSPTLFAPPCMNPRWLHGKRNSRSDIGMREVSALEQQRKIA